jgi:putative two-component system response regulator
MTRPVTDARVLVVDDQPSNVLLLKRILERDGFTNVKTTTDAREVVPLFAAFDPDILLLDLHMPHLDGFEILRRLADELGRDAFVPTVMLTADASGQTREMALATGANDFLTKPFNAKEVVLRIRNLLATRMLHLRLTENNGRLTEHAQEQMTQLESARVEVLDRLARAVDLRDNETFAHTQRVGEMSATLAQLLGLAPGDCELLRRAAPLHDIGKIGISDAVLLKPGRLTAEEFDHVRTHTTIGADLLSGSHIPVVELARVVALAHHERWDGTGYPHGLRAEAIPLSARIVAVADVFDALSHARPYKQAWPLDKVLEEFVTQRGRHFDPTVVDALLQLEAEDRLRASA